jgi:hypothetical protein
LSAAIKGATEARASQPKTARNRRATECLRHTGGNRVAAAGVPIVSGTEFLAAVIVFRSGILDYTQGEAK